MSYKGIVENKDAIASLTEPSKAERRLLDELADCEAALDRAGARRLDPADFDNLLRALEKSEIASRQDLFRASTAGDAEGCKQKAALQKRAQDTKLRLILNQQNGTLR